MVCGVAKEIEEVCEKRGRSAEMRGLSMLYTHACEDMYEISNLPSCGYQSDHRLISYYPVPPSPDRKRLVMSAKGIRAMAVSLLDVPNSAESLACMHFSAWSKVPSWQPMNVWLVKQVCMQVQIWCGGGRGYKMACEE